MAVGRLLIIESPQGSEGNDQANDFGLKEYYRFFQRRKKPKAVLYPLHTHVVGMMVV